MNQKLQEAWDTVREELGNLIAQGKNHAAGAWSQATEKQKHLAMGLGALGVVIVFVGLIGIATFVGCSSSAPAATTAQTSDAKIYLHVTAGRTSKEIGQELEDHGVIASHWKFWLVAKMNGYDNQIKTGIYELHPGMEPRDVLQKLVNGETTRIKFTIPEGFRIQDIAKRLGDEGIVDEKEFLKKAKSYRPYDYITPTDDVYYDCEGFLFPDTYELRSDYDVDTILKEMSSDMDERLTPKIRARAKELDLSIYELITFASLVEKEVRYADDRPIVAQVFWKRLKMGMPLQSDTTFQYLRDDPKEDLSLADTTVDSPYNTYQHKGLPPGPIASPGMAAIEAVLYPANTDYLYFVADRDGHNHYSRTYAAHEAVVNEVR